MNKNKKVLIIIVILAVILFAVLMTNKSAGKSTDPTTDSAITLENGVQIIRMNESAQGYSPNSFTIKKGVPVRWEIQSLADRTCANALIVPSYKIRAFLTPGKNVVEFTPTQTGQIPFSCSMRMFTGSFNVIE